MSYNIAFKNFGWRIDNLIFYTLYEPGLEKKNSKSSSVTSERNSHAPVVSLDTDSHMRQ